MRIFVKVKLFAKAERVEELPDNSYLIYTKTKPVEGKVNEAVIRLIAKYLNILKSKVTIVSGEKSTNKIIVIE
jgi:uncharacterized protein YggU (UPF0235/DUF167 family)